MKFTIQDTEFTILSVGQPYNEEGFVKQPVTFSYKGGEVTRDILISADEAGASTSAEDFYLKNREGIEKSLIDYLSENNIYSER